MRLKQAAGELGALAIGREYGNNKKDQHAEPGFCSADRRSVVPYAILLAVLLSSGLFFPGRAFCSVSINPGDNIQNAVNANPSGTTFVLNAGTYRMQQVVPKSGDIFSGQPGAILNGSKLLTSFQPYGPYWTASVSQAAPTVDNGVCEILPSGVRYDACAYPEDLFFDNRPEWRVGQLAEVAAGTWYFDYAAGLVYMGDNPAGHKVEISLTRNAFISSSATNVTITGLVIEKYASRTNEGAIGGQSQGSATGWQVSQCEFRLNHAAGLYTYSGWVVSKNYAHDNGQYGLSGTGDGVVIQDNEIARNDTRGYNWRNFGAGGTKFAVTTNIMIRRNHSHHNLGPGLWTDVNNIYTTYENNYIHDNAGAGIMHEISYNAIMRYNICVHNGLIPRGWLYEGQIFISSSPNANIYNNLAVVGSEVTSTGNHANGITIIQQKRQEYALYGPHVTTGNQIHNNVVTYLASIGQTGAAADYEASVMYGGGNWFDHNTYHAPSLLNCRWSWNGNQRWTGFKAQGQDTHGYADSETIPDDITAPFAPAGVLAVAASQSQINLSWQASTDNVVVAGYRIYRNNAPIAFSLTPSFSDTGLQSRTTYSYSVVAVDGSGNMSSPSQLVSGTTF